MLKDATVLLIRHGEKPGKPGIDSVEDGTDLTQAGRERAYAYVAFFQPYTATQKPGTGSEQLEPDGLFAAKDSELSHRPRLTLEPLADNTGLALNTEYASDDINGIVKALATTPARKIVVCWHHGKIVELAEKLTAGKSPLRKKWRDDVFGWTIQIRYDKDGKVRLDWTNCTNQKLMFDDTIDPAEAIPEPA
jgi:hypothetical protein